LKYVESGKYTFTIKSGAVDPKMSYVRVHDAEKNAEVATSKVQAGTKLKIIYTLKDKAGNSVPSE